MGHILVHSHQQLAVASATTNTMSMRHTAALVIVVLTGLHLFEIATTWFLTSRLEQEGHYEPITAIVELHGELGNWLSLLAAARNLQNRALQIYQAHRTTVTA